MSKSLPLKKHNRLLFFVRLTSCPSDSCSFFMFSRHFVLLPRPGNDITSMM